MLKKLLVVMLFALLAVPTFAQDAPRVIVEDQFVGEGTVRIAEIFSETPAWIVIHIDNGEGAPGPIVGYRAVNQGLSENVSVDIDVASATPQLFAMLHTDDNQIGVYEFGSVEGADSPVRDAEGNVITPAFNIAAIDANDQFIVDGMVTMSTIIMPEDGWLVMHGEGDPAFRPGPVITFVPVSAGTTNDLMVEVGADATNNFLSPMLHVDTGEIGTYEFGSVEGADAPFFINGMMGVTNFQTGNPTVNIDPQIFGVTMVVDSVLSDGDGWLVIHADNGEGAPGPVIGSVFVEDGLNQDFTVDVDPTALTDVIFPMLHVDTGEMGVYEFGTVEGADGPVFVNEAVLVFPLNVSPFIAPTATMTEDGSVVITEALIAEQGWLVLHADNGEGAPGPVLDVAPLVAGLNSDITFDNIDADAMTETVFPMLHVDTGEIGVYEFGSVEGADGPVFDSAGNVVVIPVMP
jgi:hypothetical protein